MTTHYYYQDLEWLYTEMEQLRNDLDIMKGAITDRLDNLDSKLGGTLTVTVV